MGISRLSQHDIENLVQNPCEESRKDVAAKVAREVAAASLSDSEREIAEGILRHLLKYPSKSLRRCLSEQLKDATRAPRDVALALAQDVDAVAVPMLMSWPSYSEADLLEAIASGTPAKQTAIATRRDLTPEVAARLVATDNATAAATLAANPHLTLTETLLDPLVARFGHREEVQGALLARHDLPVTVAERIVALVSARLRTYLRERHSFGEGHAASLASQSREKATVDLIDDSITTEDAARLVKHLKDNQRLTPSLVLRALIGGLVTFAETALAELLAVDRATARSFIDGERAKDFKTALEKSKLAPVYRSAFEAAVDGVHALSTETLDRDVRCARVTKHVLDRCKDIGGESLDDLMKGLERLNAPARAA